MSGLFHEALDVFQNSIIFTTNFAPPCKSSISHTVECALRKKSAVIIFIIISSSAAWCKSGTVMRMVTLCLFLPGFLPLDGAAPVIVILSAQSLV